MQQNPLEQSSSRCLWMGPVFLTLPPFSTFPVLPCYLHFSHLCSLVVPCKKLTTNPNLKITKEVKDSYTENYKTLMMKEIEEDT